VFFVRAATAAPLVFYDSCADSGYSVDNLAPGVPAAFAAAWAAGATQLEWAQNPGQDFSHYRLYKGAQMDFIPGPGNLIAVLTGTAYSDPGASGGYYKLSARDVNGNESGFALVTPEETVAVPPGPPSPFSVRSAQPNPSPDGRLTVEFALDGDEPASLHIFDASGRYVQGREFGSLGPGFHSIAFERTGLAPGVYFIRLKQGGHEATSRWTVVR